MRARVCQYTMQAGLVVRDWRRIGRAMNIAVAHLRAGDNTQATSASTNIIFALFDLLAMLPDTSGRRAFLCNRTVISCIGKMGLRFGSNVVTVESGLTQFGDMTKEWTQVKFLGVPLIPIDRILNTEAQITT
jgi:hypothetical protein